MWFIRVDCLIMNKVVTVFTRVVETVTRDMKSRVPKDLTKMSKVQIK